MDIERCRSCKHFDNFFAACNLYVKDIYLGDGDFDEQPVNVCEITKAECEYELL